MKHIPALACYFALTMMAIKAQPIQPDREKARGGELTIQPVTHATLVLSYQKKNIYIDPTGGTDAFKGLPAPDMIIVTDIHGDHFDLKPFKRSILPKQYWLFRRLWRISFRLLQTNKKW